MPLIDGIRQKIAAGQFEFSRHAVDQSIIRRISVQEIRAAMTQGMVIEEYPDDKYGPSCLVYGRTKAGRPLHMQCTYPAQPLIKLITVYEPDPDDWIDSKRRKTA